MNRHGLLSAAAADLHYASNYVGSAVGRLRAHPDPNVAVASVVLAELADRLKKAAVEIDPADQDEAR